MVEIADVKDRESLQAYLEELEGSVRLLTARRVAFRAAARVLPVALQYSLNEDGVRYRLPAVANCGALAFCGIASISPNSHIDPHAAADAGYAATYSIYAAQIAAQGAAHAANAAANAANAAHIAPHVAFNAANAVADAADAAGAALVATYIATNAASADDFWGLVRADLENISLEPKVSMRALWAGFDEPQYVNSAWDRAKGRMEADGSDWSFWILWYARVRAGRDFHADKLAEILNPLREDDWKNGPAHINPLFDDLLALYREEDARDGAGGEPLEQRRPANLKAIRSQIVALKDYVDAEFEFLRGQNQLSLIDGVDRDTMLEVLQALREVVDDLLATFDQDGDTSRALTHVEEKLPAVVEKAGELAELETQPNISGPIIAMTANVKYLTDSGWPGHLAVGAAAGDLGWQYLKSGWKYVAKKGAEEPSALTRFPPTGDDQ